MWPTCQIHAVSVWRYSFSQCSYNIVCQPLTCILTFVILNKKQYSKLFITKKKKGLQGLCFHYMISLEHTIHLFIVKNNPARTPSQLTYINCIIWLKPYFFEVLTSRTRLQQQMKPHFATLNRCQYTPSHKHTFCL